MRWHFVPIGRVPTRFGEDVHGPQRMNPNDFDDPLTLFSRAAKKSNFHHRIAL